MTHNEGGQTFCPLKLIHTAITPCLKIHCWAECAPEFRRIATLGLMIAFLSMIWFTPAYSQNQTTRIYGPADSDVALPTPTGVIGRADPGALQEIQAYLAATNTTSCPSMQGTGTIQYLGANEGALPATLTLQRGMESRLDVVTAQGSRSTRIFGSSGIIGYEDGNRQQLIPESAATGIVQVAALPCVLMAQRPASYIDRGISSINHLHRLTLETALARGTRAMPAHTTSVIDFYFDPATHLLLKSVTLIRIPGARNQDFIRTVSYGNYQNVDGVLVPFAYQQSINGERTWSLQLTHVQLNPHTADSYFRF